jgi:hypothetical protein
VDDDVAEVDQHPARIGVAFALDGDAAGIDIVADGVGEGA